MAPNALSPERAAQPRHEGVKHRSERSFRAWGIVSWPSRGVALGLAWAAPRALFGLGHGIPGLIPSAAAGLGSVVVATPLEPTENEE